MVRLMTCAVAIRLFNGRAETATTSFVFDMDKNKERSAAVDTAAKPNLKRKRVDEGVADISSCETTTAVITTAAITTTIPVRPGSFRVLTANDPRENSYRNPAHGCVVRHATRMLDDLLRLHKVPESHGLDHAKKTRVNVARAINCTSTHCTAVSKLALELAGLLHDADDHKYFGADSRNAARILGAVLPNDPVVRHVALLAISYVSASANGDTVSAEARQYPTLLYPRYADRLEAMGERGLVRCQQYTDEKMKGYHDKCTPQPRNEDELWEMASQERYVEYVKRGGTSSTMLDHYFDKLLRMTKALMNCGNPYVEMEARRRLHAMLDLCLAERPHGVLNKLDVAKRRADQEDGVASKQYTRIVATRRRFVR